MPRIAAWLSPRERSQVDAACAGHAIVHHYETVTALRGAVADAILLSAERVENWSASLTALVHGLPHGSVIGIVSDVDESRAIAGVLRLGQIGIDTAVDVRTAAGWRELRRTLSLCALPDKFQRGALAAVLSELRHQGPTSEGANADPAAQGIPIGLVYFFRVVFTPGTTSARQVAAALGLPPSTLMSRFFRAELPSPRQYVAHARLAWAAHLAGNGNLPLSTIAYRLNLSSPQSLQRTLRTRLGMSGSEFRRSYSGETVLSLLVSTLIVPYRDRLRALDPLLGAPIPASQIGLGG